MTGSLTPGKRADLIVVGTAAPNLGVLTDPAQLLVTAAQPANVDTVHRATGGSSSGAVR